MPETDAELLQDFTQNQSQIAFLRLVERYSDLVFAAARRQIADPGTAEDITQAAFLLLARKSASVKPDRLPAWLLTTTRLCAKQAIRTRTRRTHHEQEAAMTKPETISPAEISDPLLTATLDEAMSRLPSRVCTAIAMRHLQNRSVNDVAAIIGVSPDAAQKILSRGLAKLRGILSRKGVTLPSVAVLTAAMLHESAQRAPAAVLVFPNNPTAASLAIAKGASDIMLWASLKIAAAAIAILIAGAGSIAVFESLSETTADQSVAQATPIQPAAEVTATPSTAGLFDSPFIQVVGCRIKEPITLTLAPRPSAPSNFTIVAEQWPVLQWTLDPVLAARVSTYKISIAPTSDLAGAYTITADKLVTEEPIGSRINHPGEYDVTITARTVDSKTIASAQSRIVVKPLPTTEITFGDIQVDGGIRFATILQILNTSGGTVTPNDSLEFNALNRVQHAMDDNGVPLRFTIQRESVVFFDCRVHLNKPDRPGNPLLIDFSGAQASIIPKLPNGDFELSYTQQPDKTAPRRCIKLIRLPVGAKLLNASDNIVAREVDGQIQLYMKTIIPPGGANTVEFRYRLSN
jgi:RNA polymerase sigma factor (sigma-70 family)